MIITHKTYFSPASIYLFKVHSKNTKIMSEICPKLTIKTPERRYDIVSIVDLEQVNGAWVGRFLETYNKNNFFSWRSILL